MFNYAPLESVRIYTVVLLLFKRYCSEIDLRQEDFKRLTSTPVIFWKTALKNGQMRYFCHGRNRN